MRLAAVEAVQPVRRQEAQRVPAREPLIPDAVALEHHMPVAEPREVVAQREAGLAAADHNRVGFANHNHDGAESVPPAASWTPPRSTRVFWSRPFGSRCAYTGVAMRSASSTEPVSTSPRMRAYSSS